MAYTPTYSYPGQTNTFIPNLEQTGLLVSFTRDPKKFRLPRYTEYRTNNKRDFYFMRLDVDEPARVIDDSLFAWADGAEAPMGNNNVGGFQAVEARMKRRCFPWTLGDQAVEQADWPIEEQNAGIIMQQAVTLRTIRVASLLQASSNWPSANVLDADTLNGGRGNWATASDDPASSNYLAIKETLLGAADVITLQTNAAVDWHDMQLVASPRLVKKMAGTSEIHDYIKSPEGIAMVRGDEAVFGEWGIPAKIYTMPLVVENAVKVTSNINTGGGAATRGYCFADSNPVVVSQKGKLAGQYGGPSYSTVQVFFFKGNEMRVETFDDRRNLRQLGRVVDDYIEVLAAGAAGMSITAAL